MKAKIRFVRKYEMYGVTNYDILYASGRLSLYNEKLSKTAQKFIEGKTPRKQWNSMDGWEYIYE